MNKEVVKDLVIRLGIVIGVRTANKMLDKYSIKRIKKQEAILKLAHSDYLIRQNGKNICVVFE